MRYVAAFGRFWWDFVVGDDWTVAAGVAVTLVAVGVLADAGVNAWWLLPLAIALFTAISVWRQASSSSDDAGAGPG